MLEDVWFSEADGEVTLKEGSACTFSKNYTKLRINDKFEIKTPNE